MYNIFSFEYRKEHRLLGQQPFSTISAPGVCVCAWKSLLAHYCAACYMLVVPCEKKLNSAAVATTWIMAASAAIIIITTVKTRAFFALMFFSSKVGDHWQGGVDHQAAYTNTSRTMHIDSEMVCEMGFHHTWVSQICHDACYYFWNVSKEEKLGKFLYCLSCILSLQ